MAAKSKVPATGGGPDNEPSLVDLQQTLYESRNPTRRWLHRQRRDLVINKVCAIAGAGATQVAHSKSDPELDPTLGRFAASTTRSWRSTSKVNTSTTFAPFRASVGT